MKFFECGDFHFQNNEISDNLFKIILDAAKTHEPDFVSWPGDFFDTPIMASDKGGINKCRAFFKELSKICPSVAIYGTPSHEPPGSLDILEDCGLTVLRPGKAYGFYFNEEKQPIEELNINSGYMNPDALLFGVPELNKKSIEFLPTAEGNAKIEELFRVYVREFIAPIRMKHPGIPAYGLLHGNVSGSLRENCTDLVLKSSAILIHDEDLATANLTRWSLGHIHKPWESSRINAGYAGSWGTSWGETGFVPAFNLIEDGKPIVRIPYGTPERIKITNPLDVYDPKIAYWLDTNNPDDPAPTGHEWSRKTSVPAKKTASRIDGDTREMSLEDLFHAIDPTVSESVIKKVQELETASSRVSFDALDVSVDKVEIDGCIFFGTPIIFDIRSVEKRLSLLFGDNGAGKSSLLAFCTPYPVVVGKDTRSGRASAIKDFFPEGGTIKKYLTVNGQAHDHFISVGKYKTECFLSIDGKPQLEKGTFDELMTMCENLYGSFQDYVLTTFYVQPLQGKSGTSLMSAGMTEIRNLVQNIAGIDREKEKEFCLSKANELQNNIEKLESWIDAAKDFSIDVDAIEKELKELSTSKIYAEKMLGILKEEGIKANQELLNLEKKNEKNVFEKKRKQENESMIVKTRNDILKNKERKISLNSCVSNLATNRAIVENEEKNKQYRDDLSKHLYLVNTYETEQKSKQKEVEEKIKRLNLKIDNIKNENAMLERENSILNKPCVKCGYIEEENKKKIDLNIQKIKENETTISDLAFSIPEPYAIQPHGYTAPIQPAGYSEKPVDIDFIKKEIETALSAEKVIQEIDAAINSLGDRMFELQAIEYEIDESVANEIIDKTLELDSKRKEYQDQLKIVSDISSKIKLIEENIEKSRKEKEEVEKKTSEVKALSSDLDDYSYMAKMLQPSKIPALELEFFISAIDIEASRILENFCDARYSVTTETQQVGKKDIVDKFDIKIHDNETGTDKSFLEWNPGHKAFFNDAYVKALIKQRNERTKRTYNPVILDEADGPIQPERIKDFYTIQRREYQNHKVLAVSHSPTCHEHIESVINIKELKK